jgi:predicted DNA-binding transcriptional regulator AlpA
MTADDQFNIPRPGRFLSPKAVAHELSVTEQTIRKWVRKGVFPKATPMGSQRVFWTERQIEDFKDKVLAGEVNLSG